MLTTIPLLAFGTGIGIVGIIVLIVVIYIIVRIL